MMFEIHLSKSQHLNGAFLAAKATTLANAFDFICEFYEGPLFLSWNECDGSYLVEVYDWLDCWFDDPPVRARVIAPRGLKPPDDRIWFRDWSGKGKSSAVERE